MLETTVIRTRICGQPFELTSSDVLRVLRDADPEPITRHFVVVGGHRFPPKQVLSAVTGLDRADFTTHQARRTLMRLGFSAGRRTAAARGSRANDIQGREVGAPASLGDRLRSFSGQWVAIVDDEVIHASDSPRQLVGWLGRHGQKAQSMFRVPEDQVSSTGLAPL